MKKFFLLTLLIALILSPESVLAAKARSISSDADSVYHAEHLQKHLGEANCYATGNYIKTRSKANGSKVVGHLEQADKFILLNVENGWAQIKVIVADQTSPDSWKGMTGWVNSDYIDCICSVDSYSSKQNTPWKTAYREFLVESDNCELIDGNAEFWFAYIDDDDIPELIIDTHVTAGGCFILTYHNDKIDFDIIGSNGISWYIERKNLLRNSAGQQGYYYDNIYSIADGKWNCIYHAENDEYPSANYDVDQELIRTYYIGNQKVSQSTYDSVLNSYFDMDTAIIFSNGTNAQYLLNVLE